MSLNKNEYNEPTLALDLVSAVYFMTVYTDETCDLSPSLLRSLSRFLLQVKYKEEGKKEMSFNLYSLLPQTIATEHAKEASNLQSEVPKQVPFTHPSARFWHLWWVRTSSWFLESFPTLSVTSFLLQVKYKEGVKQKNQSSLFHQLPETTETQLAKQLSELQSEVTRLHLNQSQDNLPLNYRGLGFIVLSFYLHVPFTVTFSQSFSQSFSQTFSLLAAQIATWKQCLQVSNIDAAVFLWPLTLCNMKYINSLMGSEAKTVSITYRSKYTMTGSFSLTSVNLFDTSANANYAIETEEVIFCLCVKVTDRFWWNLRGRKQQHWMRFWSWSKSSFSFFFF